MAGAGVGEPPWGAGLGHRVGILHGKMAVWGMRQCLSHTCCFLTLAHSSLISCYLPCNVTVWEHLHIAPGKDYLHLDNGNKSNCRELNFAGKSLN